MTELVSTPPAAMPMSHREPRARLHEWLATPALAGAVALFIVTVDNDAFWSSAWRATSNDAHRVAILWSLFAIAFFTPAISLTLVPGRKLLKGLAMLLLVVAASCSYFMTEYGAVIDQAMIRNAVETTVLEATPLLGGTYIGHMLLYGALPSLAVAFAPLSRLGALESALARLAAVALGIAVLGATLYANYGAIAIFGRENHSLRLLMNPSYPLYAAATFGLEARGPAPERAPLDVRRTAQVPRKPALVVFVMGETARADRFSANGYARDTNRYTRSRGVINFPHVHSCGTSTADSLPCIFSGLGRAGFTHAAAARRESVVAALERLGVATFWRDNSTGCKGVCDEQHFEQRAAWTDPELCDAHGCFDELLLENFDELLADDTRDHFIVLHQRGSHGPAYHTDVPEWAKEYTPECAVPNLRNCSREEIDNSYDNTILYTDYFLSRVIDELDKHSERFDTAMLYVSDHGESLGENGLYLHGFPYSMAPREQTEVPMMIFASPGFLAERAHADLTCLRRIAQHPTTHDALFHTLLPLFLVESPLYDPQQDLFEPCRRQRLTEQRVR